MKMLIAAIALAVASPVLAQTAPAMGHADHAGHNAASEQAHTGHQDAPVSDPHAGHGMAGGKMDCCEKAADGTMACCAKMKAEGKAMSCCEKAADGTMECCAKMKAQGKAMPCCDKAKAEDKGPAAGADADPHAGHDKSAQL